jgi:hypothetical protein
MSQFVYLFRSTAEAQNEALGTPEAAQRSLQKWLAWVAELEDKGQLEHPGLPLDRGGSVVSSKARLVTDGPYTESKNIVLGFLVIRARDLHEAVEISKGCPIVEGGGSVEVRPVMPMGLG